MKKALFLATALVVLTLSSCKKDYTCVEDGDTISTCTSCNKAAKDLFETSCTALGGKVEKK